MEACGHIPVWSEQRVLRTNARGRHIYCERFKAWLVDQALTPGMSVSGLAMRNQVNANLLRRWMLLHGRRGATAYQTGQLLPVTVARVPVSEVPVTVPDAMLGGVPCPPEVAVEIELGGALVRVREGTSQQALVQVIAALRGVSGGVAS